MSTEPRSHLVSIIIPCYNAEKWVAETLDSAIAQTYCPLEIIVVDDGSTDGSLDIVRRYAAQYPGLIRYETGPNRGGCAARNCGFALSRGEYVMFLDADDVIAPNAIEEHVNVQSQDGTHANISVSDWRRVRDLSPGWEIMDGSGPQVIIGEHDLDNVLEVGCYPPNTILYPSRLVEKVNGWDESLLAAQDVDFLIRVLADGASVLPVRSVLAFYRYHMGHIDRQAVSTRMSRANVESSIYFVNKLESILQKAGLFERYRVNVARRYHRIAASCYVIGDHLMGDKLVSRAYELAGHRAVQGTLLHQMLCRTIGLRGKIRLAEFLAQYSIANRTRRKNMSRQKDLQ